MNSKQKGSLAVSKCVSKMYDLGYEVLVPFGDRMKYDLVIDDGYSLKKIQCKFAGLSSRNKCIASLRQTGGNQSFTYAKYYLKEDFDLLYVYTENGKHFLLDWNDVRCKSTIDIEGQTYKNYEI